MLDAFIIEELEKRRKEELARESERPRLEIPAYIPYPTIPNEPSEEANKKGVITFEM